MVNHLLIDLQFHDYSLTMLRASVAVIVACEEVLEFCLTVDLAPSPLSNDEVPDTEYFVDDELLVLVEEESF